MLESLHFTYNGISSKEMGVSIVNMGGLYKENFLPNRKIVTAKANGNPIPFFQRVDEEAVPFSLTLFIEDWDKRNHLRTIARWLYTEYHAPLTFESNSDLIIYGMFADKSELNHNGIKQGFITLTYHPKTPYIHSIAHKESYNVLDSLTEKFYNHGDKPLRFKITIQSLSKGDISISAQYDTYSETLSLRDIYDGETVWMDCKREYIVSSLEERLVRYLGDNHNDVWLEIPPVTEVTLNFIGNFNATMEFQYEYLIHDNELAYM